jgi:hypothetical protein
MEGRMTHLRSAVRLQVRARSLVVDRVSLTLSVVFVLGAVFYLWTAATSYPLLLNSSQNDPYNLLATALLHLHLSVGTPPAGLLKLPEPYNPVANSPFQLSPWNLHDFVFYHGKLFLTWGPAPVIVLLVPMHLFGLEPSSSLTAALFAIAGLGFALAALRVVLRQLSNPSLWMCALAALTLALSSAVPFILRRPQVYEEAIAGGYCFAMAGIWLACAALVGRRASTAQLALMSLCFGLAAGSRPTLGLTALMLAPVYISLRATRRRRDLLLALVVPVGACLLLLASYNQARFGNPLEFGTKYQLAGTNQYRGHFADISYVQPGVWFYTMSPPRPLALFPFLDLAPPPISYPVGLPANYQPSEPTGGLLPMAPILIFLVALPWLLRRRPGQLGPLGSPLLILAGAGIAIMLFLTYQFFSATERYEVDFATLLLFGALACWLALSQESRGWGRLLVRIGGGLLATWGCFAGLAISFTGYNNLLDDTHHGIWRTLEDIGSPLSAVIANVAGRPMLAEVNAPETFRSAPVSYTSLESPIKEFGVGVGERASVTIVSPNTREVVLVARVIPAIAVAGGASVSTAAAKLRVRGPSDTDSTYTIPPGGAGIPIQLRLGGGVNHVTFIPLAVPPNRAEPAIPVTHQLLVVASLSLTGGG